MKQNTETIQIPVFVKAKEGICYFDIDDDSNNVNNVSDILVEHINNLELRDQTAKVVLISKRDVINYYLNKIALITSHYYEFNNSYLQEFSNNGVDFVGINPDYNFVDIIQLQGKKFFVGCIFQPEFQSRPYRPHPLFVQLVKSIIK